MKVVGSAERARGGSMGGGCLGVWHWAVVGCWEDGDEHEQEHEHVI